MSLAENIKLLRKQYHLSQEKFAQKLNITRQAVQRWGTGIVQPDLYNLCVISKKFYMSVETGFDTDCNGATVGSILGMRNGTAGIDEKWTAPINNMLDTSIFGVGKVSISDCVDKTMSHMQKNG